MTKKKQTLTLDLGTDLTPDQIISLKAELDDIVKNRTSQDIYITCILDRSGSMEGNRSDYIGGFNAFLREQQESTIGNAIMSIVLFDDKIEYPVTEVPVKMVKPLDNSTFVPRGMTAMHDAIGKTLNQMLEKNHKNNFIVILTDGEENSSREFNSHSTKELIKKAEAKGWKFLYLAANQDAFAVSRGLGMTGASATFAATSHGISKGYASASLNTTMYRSAVTGHNFDSSIDPLGVKTATQVDDAVATLKKARKNATSK